MLPLPNRRSDRSISTTANSRLGLNLKTGFRIGFAEQTASNPQAAYSTGAAFEFAGSLPPFGSIPIPEINRYLLEWLENRRQALADRRLMKSEMIIDYAVVKRFYELDALRGLAIVMMLLKHGMDGWGAALQPMLTQALMAFWVPLKITLIASPATFFIGTALLHSNLFDQCVTGLAPELQPVWRALLAYTLAAIPGLWFGMTSIGASAFLALSGIGMAISALRSNDPNKLRRSWLKRGTILFSLGMLISLASVLIVPSSPIYFGILHLFGLATILLIPFISLPIPIVTASAVAIFAAGTLLAPPLLSGLPWWLLLGLLPVGRVFADYTPLAPWMGFLLIGLAIGRTLYPNGNTRKFELPDLSDTAVVRALIKIGQNSLIIYLAQTPFNLFGLAAGSTFSELNG
ncbi:MAG: heparan-alpha-glucosaminide N-acetyltransferase [Terrimicrobiaceae bacterium]